MAIGTFIGNASEWGTAGHRSTPEDYRVTYEGAVLQEFERNGYDDSDFMAIVWDEETQATKTICWGTTRGWTYANYCHVDATDEVKAKAQAYRHEGAVRSMVAEAKRQASLPGKGKTVAVVGSGKNATGARRWKGEVIEAGSVGEVFWVGAGCYGGSRWSTPTERLGVELADGRKVFGPVDAFEVVAPEQYEVTEEQARERVYPASQIHNFHTPVPGYANMVG